MATASIFQAQARTSSRTLASSNRLDQSHTHQHHDFALKHCNQGWTIPDEDPLPTTISTDCPYHDALFRLLHPPCTNVVVSSPTAATLQMIHNMPPFSIMNKTSIGTAASCKCTCARVTRASPGRLGTGRDGNTRGTGTADSNVQPHTPPSDSSSTNHRDVSHDNRSDSSH